MTQETFSHGKQARKSGTPSALLLLSQTINHVSTPTAIVEKLQRLKTRWCTRTHTTSRATLLTPYADTEDDDAPGYMYYILHFFCNAILCVIVIK